MPAFTTKYDGADNNTTVNVWNDLRVRVVNGDCIYELTGFRVEVYKSKGVLNHWSDYLDVPLENIDRKTSEEKAKKFSEEVDKKVKKIISSLEKSLKA